MGGKKCHGEPHINGPFAVPHQTWHLNWQDRVRKEVCAAIPPTMLDEAFAKTSRLPHEETALSKRPPPKRSKSVGGFPTDYYSIGGRHTLNNNSSAMAIAIGAS